MCWYASEPVRRPRRSGAVAGAVRSPAADPDGKRQERQVLTSLTDPLRFPASELMELYQNRWEIELGYREMKHSLQQHRLTLRSRNPME